MAQQLVSDRVEAEISSENENAHGESFSAGRAQASGLDRSTAAIRRLADEQLRTLTEFFLTAARCNRESKQQELSSRRSTDVSRHASSPIVHSTTLPSRPSSRQMPDAFHAENGTPRSMRRPRYINTLERIDSAVDEVPQTKGEAPSRPSQEFKLNSPRSLRRAKSSVSRPGTMQTAHGRQLTWAFSSVNLPSVTKYSQRRHQQFSNAHSGRVFCAAAISSDT